MTTIQASAMRELAMYSLSLFAAVALAGVVAPMASAQEGQWGIVEELPLATRLEIERTDQVRIGGEFQRATADQLFLGVDDRTIPIPRSDIRRVEMRAGHYAGSGAKWGVLSGAGIGAIAGVVSAHDSSDGWVPFTLVLSGGLGGVGALTGALLGWAYPRQETIYEDALFTSFHVSPIVTGGERGVRLAFVFD